MKVRISLLNDLAFKYMFGTQENSQVLVDFLNAVLNYGGRRKIAEVEIVNPVMIGSAVNEKTVMLDVRAHDEQRRCYHIEMQVKRDPFYVNRIVYYGAKLMTGQLEQGEEYRQLCRVISISIVDNRLFEGIREFHNIYRLRNVTVNHELTDAVEYHFIELPKLGFEEVTRETPLFQKWLYFIKHSERFADDDAEVPAELLEEEEIAMALKKFRFITESEEARHRILEREMAEHDWNSMMSEARLEGMEKGRAEGKTEGIIESARKLLEAGMDKSEVARILEIPVEWLENRTEFL